MIIIKIQHTSSDTDQEGVDIDLELARLGGDSKYVVADQIREEAHGQDEVLQVIIVEKRDQHKAEEVTPEDRGGDHDQIHDERGGIEGTGGAHVYRHCLDHGENRQHKHVTRDGDANHDRGDISRRLQLAHDSKD